MADKRTITVTSKREIKKGKGTKGPWKLEGISAVDAEGEPIELKLKSFDTLPVGEPIEVSVEKQSHDQFGDSYLLHYEPGRGSDSWLLNTLDDLVVRVEALERNAGIEQETSGPPPAAP